jgi:RNA polymerase sigma-70 factor (ECF subfamily)
MTADDFKTKFLPFGKSYYLIAFRMLGNSRDAEDVVQDVFVKLWNMRMFLGGVRNPQAFGVAITRNLCIDRLRSLEHRAREGGFPLESIENEPDNGQERLDDSEKVRMIRAIMADLPKNQSKVFDLRYFRDCTPEEIEKVTGLGAVNVRVLLSRARKTITERMAREDAL